MVALSVHHFNSGYRYTGTLADSVDLDEMPHKAAFHQGMHCLLRYKQSLVTEIHHLIED